MTDLYALKRPWAVKFTKSNPIRPFEDASSLEFFSEKNDASMLVFGGHSKKRPHALTLVRTFNHRVLDMLELYLDRDSFRSLSDFKTKKCAVGLKPLILVAGTAFESPTPNAYTLARSFFVDLFRGQETGSVDVEGLQYIVSIMAGEEGDGGEHGPKIHLRVYLLRTKRSGQRLPRLEVDEMGPRMDFRVGRVKEAEAAVMKEALKKPRSLEVRRFVPSPFFPLHSLSLSSPFSCFLFDLLLSPSLPNSLIPFLLPFSIVVLGSEMPKQPGSIQEKYRDRSRR